VQEMPKQKTLFTLCLPAGRCDLHWSLCDL